MEKSMRKFNEYSPHRPYDTFKVDVNLEETTWSGGAGAANNSWRGLLHSAPLPELRFAGPLGPRPDFNSNPLSEDLFSASLNSYDRVFCVPAGDPTGDLHANRGPERVIA
jgi:hypothetical protein